MSEPERPDRCETCRFWLDLSPDTGECHRHAPRPFYAENDRGRAAWWPFVVEDDFCGEWQPLPVVQRRDVPPPAGERGGDA